MLDPRHVLVCLFVLSSTACQKPAAATNDSTARPLGSYAWTANGGLMRVNLERSADGAQVFAEIQIERDGTCRAYRETAGGEAVDHLRESWVIVTATSRPRDCRPLATGAPTAICAEDIASLVKATRAELLDTYVVNGAGLARNPGLSPALNLGTRTALLANSAAADGIAQDIGALYDLQSNDFAGLALKADWFKGNAEPPTGGPAYRVRLVPRDAKDAELGRAHDRLRCSFFTAVRKRYAEDARSNRITNKDVEDQLLHDALENKTEVCQ